MAAAGEFDDFDIPEVYETSLARALSDKTLNFVVEFGRDEASIAFDLDAEHLQEVLADSPRALDRPVRWINLWAPNRQKHVVNLIGMHYKFSPRLLAIIQTDPPTTKVKPILKAPPTPLMRAMKFRSSKNDVETCTQAGDPEKNNNQAKPSAKMPGVLDHYGIASQMINYISIDVGQRFLCIGANWLHQLPCQTNNDDDDDDDEDMKHFDEGQERRVWSWIVLCDDNTVLSLHEDMGQVRNIQDMKSIRSNTVSVLSQISKFGHASASPISMQTVRQVLDDTSNVDAGNEGASNLFYYLFDDWRAVFITVAKYRTTLDALQKIILGDMTRKSSMTPDIRIIPRLHTLGRQIRQLQNLYAAYKNLILRILEPKSTVVTGANNSSTTTISSVHGRKVFLARSANQRFERLGDRIKLLILSETDEFLAEKDALISTYFNINAQKDSEATARLTRSATLLAKLSVLFLPVSLMTAYFSTNVQGLQNYTGRDYWYTFATIMSISILSLFFFGKMLIFATEWLDDTVKKGIKACSKGIKSALKSKKGQAREVNKSTESIDDEAKEY